MEDRRNGGESSCNFGDGTEQRVQSLYDDDDDDDDDDETKHAWYKRHRVSRIWFQNLEQADDVSAFVNTVITSHVA